MQLVSSLYPTDIIKKKNKARYVLLQELSECWRLSGFEFIEVIFQLDWLTTKVR